MIGTTRKNLQIKIRFQKRWWEDVDLKTFDWNGTEGPVGKSYDVLGDGSLVMVNIPGHSEGLCALKIRNAEGKYVLLFADGGYATKSWRDMITSGITLDKQADAAQVAPMDSRAKYVAGMYRVSGHSRFRRSTACN